ncbi:MAG TPA: iron ABC transporter permease [Solirubrobacteraceae bacterium]|jgi:iron(III) transport system permease protein|nr:iron ABC transporter permease [Solirubrobacteraceae bacterium]
MSTLAAAELRARRLLSGGWRRHGRPPLVTVLGAALAAALVLLPLVFLVIQAQQEGWAPVARLLVRHTTVVLLWNTVRLALVCAALCAVIGVAAAWCVERTQLPARRIWTVLLVLPLGVPDFVVSFGWISLEPGLKGYPAAVMIMTLSLYPLVYLPALAGLAGVDPALEEVARTLGLGPWRVFWKVTLRQMLPALLGGCLLVTLGLLAEYGAFEIVQYQTFTTAIFTEFKLGFDAAAACALSLVLVLLGVAALLGELRLVGRSRLGGLRSRTRRRAAPLALGRATAPVLLGLAALCGLALGVPIGSLVYWTVRGGSTTLPPASIFTDLLHTAELSCAAAALATALAIPVAAAAARHRNAFTLALERLAILPQALPGLVVALGLVSFSVRYLFAVYESAFELIVAYAILFLPLAVVGVRAAMVHASPRLEEVGRSLGRRPAAVWLRVTLPVIAPGIAAAFALVFISSATELTATLLLRPTGVDTLATQFWAYTSDFSYGAAAPYAGLMVLISAVPAYLLSSRLAALARTARA